MPFHHLTLSEREVISQMRFAGSSLRSIAQTLDRDRGTISRELLRNTLPGEDQYLAHVADWLAWLRRALSKASFAKHARAVWDYVKGKLREEWSPEQIAGRLREEFPDEDGMRISHATIYAWIREDKQSGGVWWKCLRQSERKRRKRYGSRENRGRIKDRVGIEERPKVVADRKRLGDWESDTMEGGGKRGYLVTHVDRKSRYVVAARIDDKRAASFNGGTRRAFRNIPRELCHTMTADNGKEFAGFKALETMLGATVYFADPYSSWQRGTNENTNGLLRQYFPKGLDLTEVSHQRVAAVVRKLNNRPRKCLNYRTPYEVFFEDS